MFISEQVFIVHRFLAYLDLKEPAWWKRLDQKRKFNLELESPGRGSSDRLQNSWWLQPGNWFRFRRMWLIAQPPQPCCRGLLLNIFLRQLTQPARKQLLLFMLAQEAPGAC